MKISNKGRLRNITMQELSAFEADLSGINLIEASAGTGKTYNIASLYVRALVELNLKVKDILVVTYTEAATKELRERLMTRLRESVQALEISADPEDDFLQNLKAKVVNKQEAISKLRIAIRSFDEAAIYTIHGFCYQALQEQAFESRAMFDAELIGSDKEIVREIIDDFWRVWVKKTSEEKSKQPLLKYIMDLGYNPDSLTEELSGFIGKPYLKVRPEAFSIKNIEKNLDLLNDLFKQLNNEWEASRNEIFEALNSGHLSYYRTDWLENWMIQMENWINSKVAPIDLIDKFEKFTQTVIDSSLKKSSSKKGITPPEHDFFRIADKYKSTAESLGKYDIEFKLELYEYLLHTLDERKEELQQLSYDDLLIRLRNALLDPERGGMLSGSLNKAYPIALVDEFQDTDPIQYQIFKSIYNNSERDSALFMIGDPKQSIYSFRGADIFSYLEAKKDAPQNHTYSLSRNFRSTPDLIEAVNVLFSYRENPFLLDDIPFNRVKAGKDENKYKRLKINHKLSSPLEIRELHNNSDDLPLSKGSAQERSAEDTASQIEFLLRKAKEGHATIGDKEVKAADIAVLVRSHYQAGLMRDSLKNKGIKSVQYSRDSVFKSEEAEELQYILKAVSEPAEEGFVKTALATKTMGYTAEDLLKFEENDQLWVDKLEQFSKWHSAWQNEGFAYMFRIILNDENIPQKIIKSSDGERKLTNLIHLSELIQNEELAGRTGTRSLLQWLARKMKEDDKDREEEQLRLESDENLVKVVTMHRSKGLEYPIVFCPFLWHSPEYSDSGNPIIYHNRNEETKVYLDFHGKDDPERSEKRFQMAQEDLAESVRLAYVAITRAEHKCIINWVHASKSEYSPLGYLLLGKENAFKVLEGVISKDGKYKSTETAVLEQAISDIVQGQDDLFQISRDLIKGQQQFFLSSEREKLEQARNYRRHETLTAGKSISSFSSLIQNRDTDFEIDYDVFLEESAEEITEESKAKNLNIFNFPKGPKPGTAIHHIFEQIQFDLTGDREPVIESSLKRQNIDPKWIKVISDMVKRTLKKNLTGSHKPFSLSELKPENINSEMEFYFSSGEVRLVELLGIIRPGKEIPRTLSGYSDEGFVKGFIDLTFEHGGKYYILDYKTNYLGDTVTDYGNESMKHEMQEAMYDLQYHLYTLALHRYLNARLKGYNYKKNMGGAFYLFVRGINNKGDEGIFYDCPDYELIEKLDRYMQGGTTYE